MRALHHCKPGKAKCKELRAVVEREFDWMIMAATTECLNNPSAGRNCHKLLGRKMSTSVITDRAHHVL